MNKIEHEGIGTMHELSQKISQEADITDQNV